MNKLILIGNLTKDPELSTTTSGVEVCKMTIAVSRNHVNQEGERETDFFNFIVWREQAKNCAKYLRKGSKVAVFGSVENESWTDESGKTRFTTKIKCREVEFLSSRNDNQSQITEVEHNGSLPFEDDNLPF